VFDGVTDGSGECKEEDLGNSKEGSAEDDVTYRPAVVERAEDEDELRDYIDDDAHEGPDDVDNPEANGLGEGEGSEALEGRYGDEEGDAEDSEAGEAQDLCGVCEVLA